MQKQFNVTHNNINIFKICNDILSCIAVEAIA